MNFCPKCGAQLSPGTAGCPACGPAPNAAPISQADASGFLAALFDLSFTSFITSKLIKVLYVLGIVGAAVWALILAATGISQGGTGLLLVLVSPILFLAGVIYLRVMMEVIMVIFRGAEHLAEIARQGRQAR